MIVGCFDIYKHGNFVWYRWHCVKELSERVAFPTGDSSWCRAGGGADESERRAGVVQGVELLNVNSRSQR
jgi:hypothetical protein